MVSPLRKTNKIRVAQDKILTRICNAACVIDIYVARDLKIHKIDDVLNANYLKYMQRFEIHTTRIGNRLDSKEHKK